MIYINNIIYKQSIQLKKDIFNLNKINFIILV